MTHLNTIVQTNEDSDPSNRSKGEAVINILAVLEAGGLRTMYLRNYENLPQEVGNDVDLLVPAGMQRECAEQICKAASPLGWHKTHEMYFSPLALYLANTITGETLHFDLFDRIEWHFLEFADVEILFSRRQWNGIVNIPSVQDEIYLNLMTRLIYQGTIRDKHRKQTLQNLSGLNMEKIEKAFCDHLGKEGRILFNLLRQADWVAVSNHRTVARRGAFQNQAFQKPKRFVVGIWRYLTRSIGKVLKPQGFFVVFEGADGVGKSTVLEQITPWCAEWCAGREPYRFHWKPSKSVRTNAPPPQETVDPRGKKLRSLYISLLFLTYHILDFWWGWLTRVYPAKVASRAVIGDRYCYDLFLDPRRFRLNLTPSICHFAVSLCPKPDLVVGLVADPKIIRARKPELDIEEINQYQASWNRISGGCSKFVTVSADGSREETVSILKRKILTFLLTNA